MWPRRRRHHHRRRRRPRRRRCPRHRHHFFIVCHVHSIRLFLARSFIQSQFELFNVMPFTSGTGFCIIVVVGRPQIEFSQRYSFNEIVQHGFLHEFD